MEQLVPSAPEGRAPVVTTRGTVTYIRATTATSSTPSSPTITTTAPMSVDAQRTSGHVYPINPFTMDRLLGELLLYTLLYIALNVDYSSLLLHHIVIAKEILVVHSI